MQDELYADLEDFTARTMQVVADYREIGWPAYAEQLETRLDGVLAAIWELYEEQEAFGVAE